MGRPKIYESAAERSRYYRLRKKRAKMQGEELHVQRLNAVHEFIKIGAANGDPLALQCLGENPADTAVRLIMTTGSLPAGEEGTSLDFELECFDILYMGYEQLKADEKAKELNLPDVIVRPVVRKAG